MSAFMDTSGLFAVLNSRDPHHLAAASEWQSLVARGEELVCTNYVLLETLALAQNRLGLAPVRRLRDELRPALTVVWVSEELHEESLAALLDADRRHLSLVDCVSFEVMRRLGIQHAFAFDPHFEEQGFQAIPGAH